MTGLTTATCVAREIILLNDCDSESDQRALCTFAANRGVYSILLRLKNGCMHTCYAPDYRANGRQSQFIIPRMRL